MRGCRYQGVKTSQTQISLSLEVHRLPGVCPLEQKSLPEQVCRQIGPRRVGRGTGHQGGDLQNPGHPKSFLSLQLLRVNVKCKILGERTHRDQ